MSDKETKTKTINHPLESVFDIEENTTVIEYQESVPAELVDHQYYDEKDTEIETQLEDIYGKAMDAFDAQSDIVDTVEGKYAARNAEVAVQYLNTALNAINSKSILKQHKDKINVAAKKAQTPGTVNQNLIVADRNELLRMMEDQEKNKK